MTTETLALIASYFFCDAAATERMLNLAEAQACASVYTEVKLSFLPDVDMQTYENMPAQQKAAVNLRAYDKYRAWQQANPDRVASMKADARQKLHGGLGQ